jgi:hypothetical protein
VTNAKRDAQSGLWSVTVSTHPEGALVAADRTFSVKHIVFTTGFSLADCVEIPKYPGMDKFKGPLLHSLQHKKAMDFQGKKVVVIGACTSGSYPTFALSTLMIYLLDSSQPMTSVPIFMIMESVGLRCSNFLFLTQSLRRHHVSAQLYVYHVDDEWLGRFNERFVAATHSRY